LLEPAQCFMLIVVVTLATSALIVSDEARRRALDARMLSALWFLEPGGSMSLLRFLFGSAVADDDVRHGLRRLERAGLVQAAGEPSSTSFAVTLAGLHVLERGGHGMRPLFGPSRAR